MSLQEEGELWGQFRKLVVLDELKGTLWGRSYKLQADLAGQHCKKMYSDVLGGLSMIL